MILDEDGKADKVVGTLQDITDNKLKEEKIMNLSFRDQLTGLYNRRFYEEELIRVDTRQNLPLTILMGDVNGLKLVNDSFGHSMGDELLKKVAEVITKACGAHKVISRIGGDEFIVLLPKTDAFEAEQLTKRIKEYSLIEKVGSLDVSISFGFETKMNEADDINDVCKRAEDRMYHRKLFESPLMRGKTVDTIIRTLYEKNEIEEQHSHRVSKLCEIMGKGLGLSEYKIKELKTVGLLHDIGKIAIEDTILNKPGKLTDDEWLEIKRHSEIGYRILSTVNEMSEMAEYVLAHQERWDGTGYPKGLKGNAIPLESRIISIADAYDAMTSQRSYRSKMPSEAALAELQKNAGSQFDPELASFFIENLLENEKTINL
ncbi:diguanylate cyclase [Acetobacterium bakii]|uniref:Diguanylate cyclase n=1 Tax=Acetobacterium bakii TaxID=52689 RepID=A0A0L6TXY6_9FIRM|nr:diguanylate cyclase [Acetobacterium bakii]